MSLCVLTKYSADGAYTARSGAVKNADDDVEPVVGYEGRQDSAQRQEHRGDIVRLPAADTTDSQTGVSQTVLMAFLSLVYGVEKALCTLRDSRIERVRMQQSLTIKGSTRLSRN